jgi:hypothetical protein
MTKLLAGCLASASLVLSGCSSEQDGQEEKFQAIIAKIPMRRTDVMEWKPSDVALKKKSTLFPWLRVYDLLNFRYPRSIVVDIREGTWAFAGEESSVKTIRENLPKWIAGAAIALDSPERAREVLRFYIDFTEEPYSTEVGEIGMTPEGEAWKAGCTLIQTVPAECTAEPNKSKACERKRVVHFTATLGRKGALTAETKEEPSKGCVHGKRK